MNQERIRAAAGWAETLAAGYSVFGGQAQAADAAHILGKLASGEWVLCEGKPALVREIGPSHYKDDVTHQALHARITEEP